MRTNQMINTKIQNNFVGFSESSQDSDGSDDWMRWTENEVEELLYNLDVANKLEHQNLCCFSE